MNHLHHLHFAARPAPPALLRRSCIFALLLLTSCSTAPPITQEVKIPVFTPCVTAVPPRPAFASLLLAANASSGEKVLALARDTLLHFKYEGQLEAALAGCM